MYDNIKLPEYLKVAGVKYNVYRASIKNGGEVLFHRAIVNISDEYNQDKSNEAVFHELMEITNEIYELELPHYKIQIIGSAWHQIFTDNNLYYYKDLTKK